MHAPSQFLFDGLQLCPHAIPPRLPFDLELVPASFAADKSEAQEGEGRAACGLWALPTAVIVATLTVAIISAGAMAPGSASGVGEIESNCGESGNGEG